MAERHPDKGDFLSEEDRLLWHRITRSVKPLEKKSRVDFRTSRQISGLDGTEQVREPQNRSVTGPGSAESRLPTGSAPASRGTGPQGNRAASPLDEKTARKLRRGTVRIDSRLDLHGMTQARAHSALLAFLHAARQRGDRIVLIITGKGRTGGGVLRQAVPEWLREGEFRDLASAWRSAAQAHGGDGAIYVRLRKSGKSRS